MGEETLLPSLDQIGKQIAIYSGAVPDESWKKTHKDAMACLDLEAYISQGVCLFEVILRLDVQWKKRVHAREVMDRPAFAQAVRAMFVEWLRPSEGVERRIREFEELGFTVDGAQTFRGCRSHAQAIRDGLPTAWQGRRIRTQSELSRIDFPYPPESE